MTGARKSVKIYGGVDVCSAKFVYQQAEVFNAETYLCFLESMLRKFYRSYIFLIQDNASYHKHSDVAAWFKDHQKWIEVFNLPPYSPDMNAQERLWHHTRISGTHNRYFKDEAELLETLSCVFSDMQKNPSSIKGYLAPYL